VAAFGACGDKTPPVPEQFRQLQEQEMGCATCHATGRAPTLAPGVTMTPSGHPPFALPTPS
jgi:hypothetical protein